MSNLRQAAEMALKYFEDAHGLEDTEVAIKEALRQALTPEVTPDVAKAYTKNNTKDGVLHKEWVGLTEEEIFQAYKPEMEGMPFNKPTLAVIAGYIEAKLKEKNT
jgi:hypothetical protein